MSSDSRPVSPKAHASLTAWGWERVGDDAYAHPAAPQSVIRILGHEDAGGGRQRLRYRHERPGATATDGAGCEGLEYLLMRLERERA